MNGMPVLVSRVRPAARLIFGLSLLAAAGLVAGDGQERAVRSGVGAWDPESGLGNHRVVVRVEAPLDPVAAKRAKASPRPGKKTVTGPPLTAAVTIAWRRRDAGPEKTNVLVVDASTSERVAKVVPVRIGREDAVFLFEPPTVPGDYYFYYLPYKSEGRKNYPTVKYDPPEWSADPGLAGRAAVLASRDPVAATEAAKELLRAEVVAFESADEFSAFTPMERIATSAERDALLASHPDAAYLVFPEDRALSIRLTDDIPRRWAEAGPKGVVEGEAARGEYFAFQLGVWAARAPVSGLEVRFSDLVREAAGGEEGSPAPGTRIEATALNCLNTGGVGWDGVPFEKDVAVERGRVQALWCGVRVPADARPGLYSGTVAVAPYGLPETTLAIELRVTDAILEDAGDADPFRMSRLRWLDSTYAQDDGIVPPYTPLALDGLIVSCLGRSLAIGPDGFPARIQSFFAPEMTGLRDKPQAVTAAPMKLVVEDATGRPLTWTPGQGEFGPRPVLKGAGTVIWQAQNRAEGLVMRVKARMEFDGFVDYKVELTALEDKPVSDIRLEVPFAGTSARYMMGLGFKGGLRPESFDWTWDQKKNQDALWLGAVNAGMQVGLRAENYSRPLNTNFYLQKPLHMPPSWWNDGKGAVEVRTDASGGVVRLAARAGARTVRAGQTLHFDFTLLVTPFKPLDPAAHFRERYFHSFKPLDEVAATGANVVNVHHANAVNPYINYPFLRVGEMKAYVDEAHRRGLKVKIYNTIRELSNRAPELFALRSLGHEIFTPGPGGGYSWLQEHLGGDYIAAWFVPDLKDAAVINSGMSRWHNYYIEGLDWVAKNVGIDGLYLDDVAFDRTTMKRVRKVLDRNRDGALIDLHSANQYNVRDGFASSANLYLEHFPFLDRLWFGEYFDYDGSGPDYWLVELSGIPFGLMGEMLQDGGNAWRGMVFGMTSRLPWAGDPRPLWKVWDEFGISESEMVGWWVEANPVKTGTEDVLATVFVRHAEAGTPGEVGGRGAIGPSGAKTDPMSRTESAGGTSVLIALASWAGEPVDVRLAIDWKALGIDPKRAKLVAPAIDNFQEAAEFRPGDPVRVEPGKGLLLSLR